MDFAALEGADVPRLSMCESAILIAQHGGSAGSLDQLMGMRREMAELLVKVSARKNAMISKMSLFEAVRAGNVKVEATVKPDVVMAEVKREAVEPSGSSRGDGGQRGAGGEVEVKEEAWQARRRKETLQAARMEKKARKQKFGKDDNGSDSDSDTERLKYEATPLPDDAGRVRAAKDVGMAFWTAQEPIFRCLTDGDMMWIQDLDETKDPAFVMPVPGSARVSHSSEALKNRQREVWDSAPNLLASGLDHSCDRQPLSIRLLSMLVEDGANQMNSQLLNGEPSLVEVQVATGAAQISMESRVRNELLKLGLLDPVPITGDREDTQVSQELRKFQQMLRDHVTLQMPKRRPLYQRVAGELPRDQKRAEMYATAKGIDGCLGKHGGRVSKTAKPAEMQRLCKQWDVLAKEEKALLRSPSLVFQQPQQQPQPMQPHHMPPPAALTPTAAAAMAMAMGGGVSPMGGVAPMAMGQAVEGRPPKRPATSKAARKGPQAATGVSPTAYAAAMPNAIPMQMQQQRGGAIPQQPNNMMGQYQ